MPGDFQKEKMPNGKEVMAISEQAYITYTKHLLPKQTQFGEIIFNKEKAKASQGMSGFLSKPRRIASVIQIINENKKEQPGQQYQ